MMVPKKPLSAREIENKLDLMGEAATELVASAADIGVMKRDKADLLERPAVVAFKAMTKVEWLAMTAAERNTLTYKLMKNLIREAVTDA